LYDRQTDPSLVRVVDGAYKLERFTQGREAVFVANPQFSGPKPVIDRLTFRMITSSEAAFWSLKTGSLQAANIPHALEAADRQITMGSCKTNGGYAINYVTLNFTNPKVAFFKDVRVRQALEYAINQPQMIRVAYHGNGVPSYGPVPTLPDTYLRRDKSGWSRTRCRCSTRPRPDSYSNRPDGVSAPMASVSRTAGGWPSP
jgi:ABC-type dipeptide transport system, periplasmic component